MDTSFINTMSYSDKDLIDRVISNYFIVDYGYISKVNADKTVDVTHATLPKLATGQNLQPMKTPRVELLTLSASNFALDVKPAEGDKVLLLGLKNLVQKVDEVTSATEMKTVIHYSRETMKALPLCVFNSDAKVKVEIADGTMAVTTDKKIELNGNDKQLVTWSELNQALSQFLTQLTTALKTTPIIGNGSPQAEWAGLPTQIDISSAKTTTVVTGG